MPTQSLSVCQNDGLEVDAGQIIHDDSQIIQEHDIQALSDR